MAVGCVWQSGGLTGLGDEVMGASDSQQAGEGQEAEAQTITRREQFQNQCIYLPMVRHKDGENWIRLNYQAHILPHIDWSAIEAPDPRASAPQSVRRQSATVDVDEALPVFHTEQEPHIEQKISIADFARRLSDLMPNLWQAARIAAQMHERLRADGETEEAIYDRRSYLAHVLREHVKGEVEKQAEQVFRRKLDQGEIRFDLETQEPNYQMVDSYEIQVRPDDRPLLRRDYQPVQITLFEPIFEQQFDSELEKKFAYYLDEELALQWWHRVAARQRSEYYVQGWKSGRIYPDFVAMANEIGGVTHVMIFDTKGQHLEGNLDTEYKRKVLETLEGAFNSAGRMVMRDGPTRQGIFQLVFSEQEFLEISARLDIEAYATGR